MEITRDAHVVIMTASIGGVERQSTELRQETMGQAWEVDRKVEVRIENMGQHTRARELVSKARAILPRYCTSTPLGHLTNTPRLVVMRDDLREVRELIDDHNAEPDQRHPIALGCVVLPIGIALDEEAQAMLCETVRTELTQAKAWLEAREFKLVSGWLGKNKNLSALMPALVGNVVAGAIETIRDQRNAAAKAARDNEPYTLELEQVDSAIGWCASPTKQTVALADVG